MDISGEKKSILPADKSQNELEKSATKIGEGSENESDKVIFQPVSRRRALSGMYFADCSCSSKSKTSRRKKSG